MAELGGWENFYVIVGSSAGALIGLQFVVITLVAEIPALRDAQRASGAFATPTIVHFASVLLLSAVISAPWHNLIGPAILWGVLGVFGIMYEFIVTRRMRVQTAYRPEFEDWLFHVLLPFAAYAILTGSAYWAFSHAREALFGVGFAALLLLFIGIHNAWDGITYHVFVGRHRRNDVRRVTGLFGDGQATGAGPAPAGPAGVQARLGNSDLGRGSPSNSRMSSTRSSGS